MRVLLALFLRWLHCLCHLHRGTTLWVDGKYVYIGCECGKHYHIAFESTNLDWESVFKELKQKAEKQ